MRKLLALAALFALGCAPGQPARPTSSNNSSDAGTMPSPDSPAAVLSALSARLAGLWIGPASQTVLGSFPFLNFDFRAADGHLLFGKADLDASNNLRFAFSVETLNGQDTLVFRNGGYFQGVLRDTRTVLVEHDESRGYYRFCDVSQGCLYVEAKFTFNDAEHMVLNVQVNQKQHLVWETVRRETRDLPKPFPVDAQSQGNGTAPFPPMPTLTATVSWSAPLTSDADVWMLLSTSACISAQSCNVSRAISVAAAAGATSATVTLDQVHPGNYFVVGVVDRNRNFRTTLAVDHGDSITNPYQNVTIAPTGTTTTQMTVIRDL